MRISIIKVLTRKIPRSFWVAKWRRTFRDAFIFFCFFLNLCFECATSFLGAQRPNSRKQAHINYKLLNNLSWSCECCRETDMVNKCVWKKKNFPRHLYFTALQTVRGLCWLRPCYYLEFLFGSPHACHRAVSLPDSFRVFRACPPASVI